MPATPGILVVGPPHLAAHAREAFANREVIGVPHPLAGLWRLGHEPLQDVLVALNASRDMLRALRSMRQIAPQARIVVACSATEEPQARQALDHGADDYLLEPLAEADLRRSFRPAPRAVTPPDGPGAMLSEVLHFGEILRNLAEGPQATLDRCALLVMQALGSRGVALRLDDLNASIGDVAAPVLEEPIRRGSQIVGRVQLGPRAGGSYTGALASRLSDLGVLVEAAVREARERDRLHELAWTDDLSQLHNRRYCELILTRLLSGAAERQSRVTVVMFDIDDFKAYNDAYGHDTGDALIREVGVLLKRCSRADDVVARFGGDEFVVLLWDAEEPRVPGSRHPSEAPALAERYQRAINEHSFQCLGPHAPGPVTLSGGLACFPWHGTSREELLRAADRALLTAKRAGKNRIVLAGSEFPTPQA